MRKSKIIKNQKELINRLIDDICDLENEIEKKDKIIQILVDALCK